MPRISEFYGIAIYMYNRMYYRDHAPPHFHAIYGEHEAVVDIGAVTVREGHLPRRAWALVAEWATTYRDDLMRNWHLAGTGQPLEPIAPLD